MRLRSASPLPVSKKGQLFVARSKVSRGRYLEPWIILSRILLLPARSLGGRLDRGLTPTLLRTGAGRSVILGSAVSTGRGRVRGVAGSIANLVGLYMLLDRLLKDSGITNEAGRKEGRS